MIAGWRRSKVLTMEFHILLAGVEIGPLTEQQVRAYLHDGLISATDLSRRSGAADWEPVTDMLAHLPVEAPPAVAPPSPAPASEIQTLLPIDILADSEPSFPLAQPAAPPTTTHRETASLPKTSDFRRLSSTAKAKRKPSKLVIQPMIPQMAPDEAVAPFEPKAAAPPSPVETPPKDLAPPPSGNATETIPTSPAIVSDPEPQPKFAEVSVPEPQAEPIAISVPTPQPEPAAVPVPQHNVSPSVPAPSPVSSKASSSISPAPTHSRNRKKKTFWQKNAVPIYAASALAFLIILPVCAWLFLGLKHNPFTVSRSDFASSLSVSKDEEDRILASNPQTAVDYTKRGLVRKDRGMADAALSDFDQATRLDPKYVPAYYGRGLAQLIKGNWDPAISDFDEVLSLDPNRADAFNSRAYARQNKGDLDAAVADYTQALALDPKLAKAYFNRGMIKLNRGDRDGAITDFNHTLDLDPTMAYAYFNRGDAKNADGNFDGAIADYTQALTLNPKIALAYSHRGFARLVKGDLDGALDDFTRALDLNPHLQAAYYNRAMARLSKGDLDGAIADSTKAIELDPKDATSYCNRGLALLGKGQLDDAKRDLESFCELAPHDPAADAAHLYLWMIATEQNPRGDANDDLADVLLNNWNSPSDDLYTTIARFVLNRVGESDVFAAADASDPLQDEVQHGKAWYFVGMKHLFTDDQATAINDFRKVLQTDKKDFCEYFFAREQLRILGASPIAPVAPTVPATQ